MKTLLEARKEAVDQAAAIESVAKESARDLTDEEVKAIQGHLDEADRLDKEIEGAETRTQTAERLGRARASQTLGLPRRAVELDMPVTGLQGASSTPADPCTPGDPEATTQATVTVTVPTYSRSDPWVPTLRVPDPGFRGTAFTKDPAKWDGGGRPGRGDPAVMRVYTLPAPNFDGSGDQVGAFTAVADDLLALFGELAFEVEVQIKGVLDTRWAGLGRTLRLVDSTGARDLSFLSGVTLAVVAVEWDVERSVTTAYAGTRASGRSAGRS